MDSKIDRIAKERAEASFASGLFCAESVVKALAEVQNIDSDLVPKMATAFCGGMARTCGTCGALTGAVMGLSLGLGRSCPGEAVRPVYAATQRLVTEFEQTFGSRNCSDLLGCDLNTEAGQAMFREQDLARRCARISGGAAAMAVRILQDSATEIEKPSVPQQA